MRLIIVFVLISIQLFAQTTPKNGVETSKPEYILLKNAEIIISPAKTISKGSILLKNDVIVEVGNSISRPSNCIEIDCEGKTIVPAFIELNTNLGMSKEFYKKDNDPYSPQINSSKSENFYWNESIHPEFDASLNYQINKEEATKMEAMGFGFALTHLQDGIARGTSSLISTSAKNTKYILKDQVGGHFSFDKGTSHQTYPSSQMGAIALLRQTFYDLEWYNKQGYIVPNLSLEALKTQIEKPLFFETEEALEITRAQKIAKEFKYNFNYIGSGNEYQYLSVLKNIDASIILPLSFPKAFDVKDVYINKEIPLSALKHWELAPSNPYLLLKNGNTISLSATGCKSPKEFWSAVHKVMERGLTQSEVLSALTTQPSKIIGMDSQIGTLDDGKFASFFVYSANPFSGDAELLEKWILGEQEVLKNIPIANVAGNYNLQIDGIALTIEVTQSNDKYTGKFEKAKTGKEQDLYLDIQENDVTIQYLDSVNGVFGSINLRGKVNSKLGVFEGDGTLPNGKWIKWSAIKVSKVKSESKTAKTGEIDSSYIQKIWFPNMGYGFDSLPKQQAYVIKNVTVWTSETAGILKNAAVIIQNGKIKFVGEGGYQTPLGAIEIDGKGMYLTSGIIDEHSHIAISKGVNEGGQAIAAEVSIADVVTNSDINIYRQLAGGVTTSQLLHGSADPIGGQSALIKLKWGMNPEDMLIPNAPKFIKFALGENVKQSNWGDFNTVRFPQTRMGVEQLYVDAFNRAIQYKKEKNKGIAKRRDLELDVLVEILERERNITCHSYIQSEINMLMHVADTFGFKINTFTHILEGYKLADKMAAHGAGASTFSDWWAYKYEVKDAIPYNAKLMHDQGIVVAINSDDAEMGRRLNQEAAKAVKYGGMSEQEAWKMVTLNPAKLLHLDDRIGSIKEGKDADLVLWTANPLSIEAIADMVFIDGIKFYDRLEDANLRNKNRKEHARIISKMEAESKSGTDTKPFQKQEPKFYHCNTLEEEGTSENNHH